MYVNKWKVTRNQDSDVFNFNLPVFTLPSVQRLETVFEMSKECVWLISHLHKEQFRIRCINFKYLETAFLLKYENCYLGYEPSLDRAMDVRRQTFTTIENIQTTGISAHHASPWQGKHIIILSMGETWPPQSANDKPAARFLMRKADNAILRLLKMKNVSVPDFCIKLLFFYLFLSQSTAVYDKVVKHCCDWVITSQLILSVDEKQQCSLLATYRFVTVYNTSLLFSSYATT